MATRDLTANVKAELIASVVRPAFFFKGVFSTSTIRLSTLQKDVTLGGESYLGNGWLTRIQADDENDQLRATGMVVTLSGIPPVLLSIALSQPQAIGTGELYFATLDSNFDIIADEYLVFKGKLNAPSIRYSGSSAEIELGYETVLINKFKTKEHRYTNESQRNFYADDAGFEYLAQVQKWSGYWGSGRNPLNISKRRDIR